MYAARDATTAGKLSPRSASRRDGRVTHRLLELGFGA
jgi:hypothetical protein